jgi:hypothetical protein
MDHLVANRVADAIADVHAPADVALMNSMMDSCGRPISCKSENDGVVGEFDGHEVYFSLQKGRWKAISFPHGFCTGQQEVRVEVMGLRRCTVVGRRRGPLSE